MGGHEHEPLAYLRLVRLLGLRVAVERSEAVELPGRRRPAHCSPPVPSNVEIAQELYGRARQDLHERLRPITYCLVRWDLGGGPVSRASG